MKQVSCRILNAGDVHNLELSLGISSPSNGPKGNGIIDDFHLSCIACEIPSRESLMVTFQVNFYVYKII